MALLLVNEVADALGAELAAELVETGGHHVRFRQLVAAADDLLEALPPGHHFDDEPATVRVTLELVDDVPLLQSHDRSLSKISLPLAKNIPPPLRGRVRAGESSTGVSVTKGCAR